MYREVAIKFHHFRTYRKLAREEDDESNVPDVNASVQEILVRIFTSMYNHQVIFSWCLREWYFCKDADFFPIDRIQTSDAFPTLWTSYQSIMWIQMVPKRVPLTWISSNEDYTRAYTKDLTCSNVTFSLCLNVHENYREQTVRWLISLLRNQRYIFQTFPFKNQGVWRFGGTTVFLYQNSWRGLWPWWNSAIESIALYPVRSNEVCRRDKGTKTSVRTARRRCDGLERKQSRRGFYKVSFV